MSKIKLCLQQDIITGFSYSFCKALIGKLKELYKSDKLFVDGNKKCESPNYGHSYTRIGSTVISYLQEQMATHEFSSNTKGVEEAIETAEEFLLIFEQKQQK